MDDRPFLLTADEVLASNLRRVRRRRFWDRRYMVHDPLGGHDDPAEPADDLEQEHVAARMRDLGHNWVQQTVSEVERARSSARSRVRGSAAGVAPAPALDPGASLQ